MHTPLNPSPNRLRDIHIATKILGYESRIIRPNEYPREVMIFSPSGYSEIVYSYDDNACNYCPWRDPANHSLGIAAPLPHYADELDALLGEMSDRGIAVIAKSFPLSKNKEALYEIAVHVASCNRDGSGNCAFGHRPSFAGTLTAFHANHHGNGTGESLGEALCNALMAMDLSSPLEVGAV